MKESHITQETIQDEVRGKQHTVLAKDHKKPISIEYLQTSPTQDNNDLHDSGLMQFIPKPLGKGLVCVSVCCLFLVMHMVYSKQSSQAMLLDISVTLTESAYQALPLDFDEEEVEEGEDESTSLVESYKRGGALYSSENRQLQSLQPGVNGNNRGYATMETDDEQTDLQDDIEWDTNDRMRPTSLEASDQLSSNHGDSQLPGNHGDSLLEEDAPHKVLLLTYFRGGSTFLGDVFNHNRDVFYWFEPLAAPVFSYKRQNKAKDYDVDDAENALSRPTDLVDKLVDILQQIVECDMDSLDINVLKHYFAANWRKSSKFSHYQACINRLRGSSRGNVSDHMAETCRKHLQKPCVKSPVRVIKSIRLFVEETVPLIHTDPDVKLVYYVRDPRGILLSRWSLVKMSPDRIPLSRIELAATYLCAKMRADIDMALKIRERYPDRILLLRYEDLAHMPIRTVRYLYRFVGIELPPHVLSWVEYATHAIKSDGSIGTRRENATAVASRWRTELSPVAQSIIVQHCADVIDSLYSGEFSSLLNAH